MIAETIPDTFVMTDLVTALTKDIKEAVKKMSPEEARYLVDNYYTMQKNRIRAGNQIAAMEKSDEPNAALRWYWEGFQKIESSLKGLLHGYARTRVPGQWALSICGVGPVIAAGLLAHIDITKSPTISSLWSFAGLNPTAVWAKGQKRPWNARLKTLCWHMGECFKRSSGSKNTFYGLIYKAAKEKYVQRNEDGEFEEKARSVLASKKFSHDTTAWKCYSQGKYPPGRLDLMAMRKATKQFLAHYYIVAYEDHYGKPAESPWIIAHGGHTHFVPPPNWPLET